MTIRTMMTRTRGASASRRTSRNLFKLAAVALTGVVLTASLVGPAAAQQHRGHDRYPSEIALPVGFLPEGITVGGSTAYLGSRADGDIYAAISKPARAR